MCPPRQEQRPFPPPSHSQHTKEVYNSVSIRLLFLSPLPLAAVCVCRNLQGLRGVLQHMPDWPPSNNTPHPPSPPPATLPQVVWHSVPDPRPGQTVCCMFPQLLLFSLISRGPTDIREISRAQQKSQLSNTGPKEISMACNQMRRLTLWLTFAFSVPD